MIIHGFEFKTTQDERMQHALLVRPATGGQWRVYTRFHSAHVVSATAASLQRRLLCAGLSAEELANLPVAAFRVTKRGRQILLEEDRAEGAAE